MMDGQKTQIYTFTKEGKIVTFSRNAATSQYPYILYAIYNHDFRILFLYVVGTKKIQIKH